MKSSIKTLVSMFVLIFAATILLTVLYRTLTGIKKHIL